MRDGVPRRSCYPLLFSLISNMRLEMVQDGDIQTVVTNGRLKGSRGLWVGTNINELKSS